MWILFPGQLSSHSSLSSYGLFASLTLWRLFVPLRSLVQVLGSCPASGAPWSSAMSPIPRKGSGNNDNSPLVVEPLPWEQEPYYMYKLLHCTSLSMTHLPRPALVQALPKRKKTRCFRGGCTGYTFLYAFHLVLRFLLSSILERKFSSPWILIRCSIDLYYTLLCE